MNTIEAKLELAAAWDLRITRLLGRLPNRITARIRWLRHPDRRVVRLMSGLLLVLGGLLSILPVLGIWMLPLGLALLAEDWPGLKPRLERISRRLEGLWRSMSSKVAKAKLSDKN